jgi:tetratricopeptide (TPR) repeat protein
MGRSAAAVALLAVLAVAVVGVFVFLPRWMASRPQPVAVAPRPADPAQATLPESPKETREAPASAHEDEPTIPAARPPAIPRATQARPPAEDPGGPEWTRAMSDGLAALDRGQFAEAQAAFARAEAARPGTRVVADAIKRTEEGLKGEALSRHRTAGEAAEAREDWRGALAQYDAALKLEPQIAFAQQGRARSLPRAVLDETLAGYLQRPERLSAEAVAREAEGVLDRARDTAPAGPRLQQQTAALERVLHDARTPVDVRLVSDGLTEVSVLRVGTIGTFRGEKKVALRPGSYVVLGKRQGYRDARKTLVVSPSQIPAPLEVRCSETL